MQQVRSSFETEDVECVGCTVSGLPDRSGEELPPKTPGNRINDLPVVFRELRRPSSLCCGPGKLSKFLTKRLCADTDLLAGRIETVVPKKNAHF